MKPNKQAQNLLQTYGRILATTRNTFGAIYIKCDRDLIAFNGTLIYVELYL